MKKQLKLTILLITLFLALIFFPACKKKEAVKKEPEVIKIGAILPLTGNLSFLGEPGKNAIELLKEELDKENIKVFLYDNKGDAKIGISAFRKAYDMDKVKIFITTLTGVSLSIKPVAKANNVMQVIVAIYPKIASDYDLAIQFCYNAEKETELIFNYLKSIKHEKVFFFASRDPITELQINKYFKPLLEKENIEFMIEPFDIGTKDFKSIVSKFATSKADIGVLLGYGSDFQGILREIANQGLMDKVKLIGGIGYLELPQYVSYDMVKNSIFTAPKFIVSGEGSAKYEEFKRLYKSRFNKEPTYDAAYTYDAIKTIAKAIKALKTGEPKKTIRYILSHTFEGVTGPIKFKPDGTLITELTSAKFNKNMQIIPAE